MTVCLCFIGISIPLQIQYISSDITSLLLFRHGVLISHHCMWLYEMRLIPLIQLFIYLFIYTIYINAYID